MHKRVFPKKVLLGVSGGIAAYKSCYLVRRLREEGCEVRVVMTEAAKEFVSPMTFQALSGNPVHDSLFDLQAEAAMGHIELARWAEFLIVAPASADFIARLAHGHCNDLLTTVCLTTRAPMAVVPAMNVGMWENIATQENIKTLKSRGVDIWGPAVGSQACGEEGLGRMLEPEDILHTFLTKTHSSLLLGKTILITAGPTQEPIDSVRYITNHSSGKMGYALANAGRQLGAKVILVSGPTSLVKPQGVDFHSVITAQDMYEKVQELVKHCDIFIGAAAVADYTIPSPKKEKIKKSQDTMTLDLVRTTDIISHVAKSKKKPFIVGFAAETDNVLNYAKKKREEKKLDMIIANDVSQKDIGFNSDENAVTVCWEKGEKTFPKQSKETLAYELLTFIAENFKKHE